MDEQREHTEPETDEQRTDQAPPQEAIPEEERDTASGGPADPPQHDA